MLGGTETDLTNQFWASLSSAFTTSGARYMRKYDNASLCQLLAIEMTAYAADVPYVCEAEAMRKK